MSRNSEDVKILKDIYLIETGLSKYHSFSPYYITPLLLTTLLLKITRLYITIVLNGSEE